MLIEERIVQLCSGLFESFASTVLLDFNVLALIFVLIYIRTPDISMLLCFQGTLAVSA